MVPLAYSGGQEEPKVSPAARRPVGLTEYALLQQCDIFAAAYNAFAERLAAGKIELKLARKMHDEWRRLQKMPGWPREMD